MQVLAGLVLQVLTGLEACKILQDSQGLAGLARSCRLCKVLQLADQKELIWGGVLFYPDTKQMLSIDILNMYEIFLSFVGEAGTKKKLKNRVKIVA